MIAIVDTGIDDFKNLKDMLERMDISCVVTPYPEDLFTADKIILYGTQSFGETMCVLEEGNWVSVLNSAIYGKKPLFGIGTGMQLMFTSSDEGGFHQGLNFFHGHVLDESYTGIKAISFTRYPHRLLQGVEEGDVFFTDARFLSSVNSEDVIAETVEEQLPAIVVRGHLCGLQFLPEKSGDLGRQLLHQLSNLVYT